MTSKSHKNYEMLAVVTVWLTMISALPITSFLSGISHFVAKVALIKFAFYSNLITCFYLCIVLKYLMGIMVSNSIKIHNALFKIGIMFVFLILDTSICICEACSKSNDTTYRRGNEKFL